MTAKLTDQSVEMFFELFTVIVHFRPNNKKFSTKLSKIPIKVFIVLIIFITRLSLINCSVNDEIYSTGNTFDEHGRDRYFGYPGRNILNQEKDRLHAKYHSKDLINKWIMNPLPYTFIDGIRKGTQVRMILELNEAKTKRTVNEIKDAFQLMKVTSREWMRKNRN